MKTIIFKIDENNHEKLRKKAKKNGLTMSGYVRLMIIRDLKGE